MKKISDSNQIHQNYPQIDFHLLKSRHNICLWGRGTGKTEGPTSNFTLHNALTMPRSNGVIAERTYVKLLEITLPALCKGWEKMGYKEDLHFWVKKVPPKHLNLDKAYRYPRTYEHYISFYNGSGIFLGSMDRPATLNGISTDWQAYEETRLLKEESVRELLLTNRDNKGIFGHLWQHTSVLMVSDMPRSKKQKWLMRYVDQMDPHTFEVIFQLQCKIEQIKAEIQELQENTPHSKHYTLKRLEGYVNELKKDAIYVSFASTLDNIHALGVDTVKGFRRSLTALDYNISVLNKYMLNADGGFYPTFDEDKHTYEAINYDALDKLKLHKGEARNCYSDSDIDHSKPLEIACDFGANINLVIVGQREHKKIKILKYIYVLHPGLIKDAIEQLCQYYSPSRNRSIVFHYDHTAVGRTGLISNTYADEVRATLSKHKWKVLDNYIGQTPSHDFRYRLMNKIFTGGDDRLPTVLINRNNCSKLIQGIQGTEVKNGIKGFEKNKSDEKNQLIDQSEITHGTDAMDTLICGIIDDLSGAGDWL